MLSRPINILVVEDNETDLLLIKQGFKFVGSRNNIYHTNNGLEALDFLNKRNKYSDSHTPDIVLLDLNLPGMSGMELLEEIKKDIKLTILPIIVLTHSTSEKDLKDAYDLYANAYIIKPSNIDGFKKMALSIENFWLNNVNLPPIK